MCDALHRLVIHLRRAVCTPPYRLEITMSPSCSRAFTGSAYGSASDTAFPSPSLKLPLKARSPRLGSDSTSLTSERSEEHTSELQSLMRISYAVFCLKKKNKKDQTKHYQSIHT